MSTQRAGRFGAAGAAALFLLSGLTSRAAIATPAIPPLAAQHYDVRAFGDFVAEASQRFGIPSTWIFAVMQRESGGIPRAVSPAGAMGLMQIMPATWAELRAQYGLGADPYDPHDNILAGAAYLREMHDRYGSPGFLAAYNAGPDRYEAYLSNRQSLPIETRDYVAALAPIVGDKKAADPAVTVATSSQKWSAAPIFVALSGNTFAAARPQINASSDANAAADFSRPAVDTGGLFVPDVPSAGAL